MRLKGSCCCSLLNFTWISGHFGVQFGVYDVRKGVNINLFYKSTIIIGFLLSRNINIPIWRLKWSFCCILLCFMWISGHFGVQLQVCDVIRGVNINLFYNLKVTIGFLHSRNIVIPISRVKGPWYCILLCFTWISGYFRGTIWGIWRQKRGLELRIFKF